MQISKQKGALLLLYGQHNITDVIKSKINTPTDVFLLSVMCFYVAIFHVINLQLTISQITRQGRT